MTGMQMNRLLVLAAGFALAAQGAASVDARFEAAWNARRGEPYGNVPVSPPIFHGHPRVARGYSREIILFAARVFHNSETNFYGLANAKLLENCRFYIANKDVRNDRDSFYWNRYGGSWDGNAAQCRPAYRVNNHNTWNTVGFRLACPVGIR